MSVKYYDHTQTGAPVLSGTAGSLIAVLDACLVDGFGLGTLDSLVVASDVATAARSAGHPFQVGQIALIAGASPGGLNGEHKVLSVTPTTYTFATSGIADQTASGTITHKVAPAGWSNTAVSGGSSTLKAYQPTDAGALGMVLRVDDSANYHARVVGYESMTDVNTGTAPFPTNEQFAGGGYWPRSSTNDATARPWYLIADEMGFFFSAHHHASTPLVGPILWFGDIVPQGSGDSAHCVLQAFDQVGNNSYYYGSGQTASLSTWSATSYFIWAARAYTGIGSSTPLLRVMDMHPPVVAATGYSGNAAGTNFIPYPNGADNGLILAPMRVLDQATCTLRGWIPGLYGIPQKVAGGQFASGDSVGAVPGLPGRTLRVLTSMAGDPVYTTAHVVIDCTGPWRS